MIPSDTLQTAHATGIIGSTLNAANEIFAIGKAVITSGVVVGGAVWCFKKITAYFAEHHNNIGKHNTDREAAVDKKEDLVFSSTIEERKQNFELMKSMIQNSIEQTAAIKANAEAIKANADVNEALVREVQRNGTIMQESACLIARIADAMHAGNADKIQAASEQAFTEYVDFLQKNPEAASKLLQRIHNPLSAVLGKVAGGLNEAGTGLAS